MNKHSVLVLGLLTAIVGCGSSNDSGTPAGMAGSAGHAGAVAMAGAGGAAAAAGSAGTAVVGGAAGVAGSSGGSGGACDISPLVVFTRSDTDQSWDDNDFDSVVLGPDPCPQLVTVTWPHEAGWQNADPAESNHEVTHFTLDSGTSVDLTNKKLSLTIELASDVRGPTATAGGYTVSLVSVSSFQRVVSAGGAGGADAGGASGTGGTSGSGGASGSAGSGGAGASGGGGISGGGGDSSGGTAGADVTTETGYVEAESPVAERATLRFAGDRATVTFPLPNKTTDDSYDPTKVIKINVRIYSVFSDGQSTGAAGAGGMAGVGGTSGSGGSAGKAGAGGTAGVAGLGGSGGASAASGAGGAGGSNVVVPVYDYQTSVFSISNFTIKDASAP